MSTIVARQEPRDAPGLLGVLVRRRVPISIVLFGTLLALDWHTGSRPQSLLNIRDWHAMLGVALTLCGLAMRSWAAGTLHKWHELTTIGPYRMIRNPLYAGSFMLMLGFGLMIGHWQYAMVAAVAVAALYVMKVTDEERTLGIKFGSAWKEYAAATPRFLPRRFPRGLQGDWAFSQWMKNEEYQAIAASAAGMVAIQLWHAGLLG